MLDKYQIVLAQDTIGELIYQFKDSQNYTKYDEDEEIITYEFLMGLIKNGLMVHTRWMKWTRSIFVK